MGAWVELIPKNKFIGLVFGSMKKYMVVPCGYDLMLSTPLTPALVCAFRFININTRMGGEPRFQQDTLYPVSVDL